MVYKYDFLIIGAGVAGMSYALKVARAGRKVCMISKTSLDEANTSFAQGGVASVTNLELDNFQTAVAYAYIGIVTRLLICSSSPYHVGITGRKNRVIVGRFWPRG